MTLSAGQRVAPLSDHLVVPVVHVADEPVGPGYPGGGHHLVSGGVGTAERDVVVERVGEQEGLVGYLADVVPETGQGQVTYVGAVNQDGAGSDVVEAGQQPGHGGFPATGTSHQGHRLAGLENQVEVHEHGRRRGTFRRGVGEGHAAELNPPPGVDQRPGAGPVDDLRLLVEDLVDADRRGGGPLGLEQDEAEHSERDGDHGDVAAECEQGTDPELVVDGQVSPVEQYQGHAEPGECLDQGVKPGPGLDQGGGRPAEAIGDLG